MFNEFYILFFLYLHIYIFCSSALLSTFLLSPEMLFLIYSSKTLRSLIFLINAFVLVFSSSYLWISFFQFRFSPSGLHLPYLLLTIHHSVVLWISKYLSPSFLVSFSLSPLGHNEVLNASMPLIPGVLTSKNKSTSIGDTWLSLNSSPTTIRNARSPSCLCLSNSHLTF